MLVNRCWRPCTAGAAKPVAVGHHRWVHLPGLVTVCLQLQLTDKQKRIADKQGWPDPFLFSSSPSVSTAVRRLKSQRRKLNSWGATRRSGTSTASWTFSTPWWTRATLTASLRSTPVEVWFISVKDPRPCYRTFNMVQLISAALVL